MKKATKIISALTLLTSIFISGSSFVLIKNNTIANKKGDKIIPVHARNTTVSAFICDVNDKDPGTTLKTNMRKLWEDHVTWTRNVILCLVDELPGVDQAVKRLMQNQTDIGNAIKPYYGEEAGKKLTEMLT